MVLRYLTICKTFSQLRKKKKRLAGVLSVAVNGACIKKGKNKMLSTIIEGKLTQLVLFLNFIAAGKVCSYFILSKVHSLTISLAICLWRLEQHKSQHTDNGERAWDERKQVTYIISTLFAVLRIATN